MTPRLHRGNWRFDSSLIHCRIVIIITERRFPVILIKKANQLKDYIFTYIYSLMKAITSEYYTEPESSIAVKLQEIMEIARKIEELANLSNTQSSFYSQGKKYEGRKK